MRVGVIAVQGDFSKHIEALQRLDIPNLETSEVRTPGDLAQVDRVILPGGESTTVGILMQRFGLGDALIQAGRSGMPMWGTCMGMIMLAKEVEDRDQYSLGLLDITVKRNYFGAQVHSFEDEVVIQGIETPVTGVFIRAPIVTRMGSGVSVLCEYEGTVVGVRQGSIIGTSFHPELTEDTQLHRWFLTL